MKTLGVGIIGCGNISAAYMTIVPMFKGIEIRACADINPDAAKARALEFDIRAESIEDLLKADDIDIVVNLTIPAAHVDVSSAILKAGKHVYSEKPFVLSTGEGNYLKKLADEKGLRVGSAPDTFLGSTHQRARHLVDSGKIGKITSGTAVVQSHGMEHWHPNPDFFFQPGAGPVLDLGPYYISNLIQLISPVKRVTAMTSSPSKTRTISCGARNGEKIPVNTPTTVHALLEFENGAIINMISSWDVWAQGHSNMELYGEKGSLFVPDPNFFGGELRLTEKEDDVALPDWEHPFEKANYVDKNSGEHQANYRGAGLADMAQAIHEGRPHRCSLEFAHHVVDVMTSILKSGETGQPINLSTTCDRPAVLDAISAQALLK